MTAILVVSSGLAGMDWKIEQRDKPPPDQQLLTNYEKHEATLNQLVEMVKKDKGLTRVDTDWTDPQDPTTIGVSTERINEYRRLLREVRVPRGFSAWSQAEIDFLYWGIGSAVSDDVTKGYAYLESAPQNLAESLDGYKRPPTRDVVKVYRHIRGNWYLFYEYLPG
ncbi:MAG: hypothetical protein DME57_11240 [Verrucomicrobia bacterium]|nr:MAG: hypothetical protein DME57_11240 [Verrucomicrobiota bacterium]